MCRKVTNIVLPQSEQKITQMLSLCYANVTQGYMLGQSKNYKLAGINN